MLVTDENWKQYKLTLVEETSKKENSRPIKGNNYWFVCSEWSLWCLNRGNDEQDTWAKEMGNIYRTKYHAQAYIDLRKFIIEMKEKYEKIWVGWYCLERWNRAEYTWITETRLMLDIWQESGIRMHKSSTKEERAKMLDLLTKYYKHES